VCCNGKKGLAKASIGLRNGMEWNYCNVIEKLHVSARKHCNSMQRSIAKFEQRKFFFQKKHSRFSG
jgi:hypothetical protein